MGFEWGPDNRQPKGPGWVYYVVKEGGLGWATVTEQQLLEWNK